MKVSRTVVHDEWGARLVIVFAFLAVGALIVGFLLLGAAGILNADARSRASCKKLGSLADFMYTTNRLPTKKEIKGEKMIIKSV